MTRREELEQLCAPIIGNKAKMKDKIEALQSAFWKSHNANYADAMANQLMGHGPTPATDDYYLCCELSGEVSELLAIYKEEQK